jgi:diguanylate cyclase (GGDEF)-like protein
MGPQIRGFGFTNEGSVDTIFSFFNALVFNPTLNSGFPPVDPDATRRDVEQFMLAFDSDLAPIVGQQVTLGSVVSRDAGLVELFVNANLRATDVVDGGPGATRAAELGTLLRRLAAGDGIVLVDIRGPNGQLIASSDATLAGQAGDSTVLASAFGGTPSVTLLEGTDATNALGNGTSTPLLREFLPLNDGDSQTRAVLSLWRDAGPLLAGIDATRRDIMVVTLVAAFLLAAALFLIFRAAQARLARQHDQLIEAGRRDALTDLLNHGSVVAALAEDIEAARASGASIGVAIVDIDNFRLFNDTHGHEAADEVLLSVADLVTEMKAPTRVARYGPDEFLILRSNVGVDEMSATVAALMEELQQLSVHFGESEALPVTVSVGIAAAGPAELGVAAFIDRADDALYRAKRAGRDRYAVADAAANSVGASDSPALGSPATGRRG